MSAETLLCGVFASGERPGCVFRSYAHERVSGQVCDANGLCGAPTFPKEDLDAAN